jgi:hypothetical protein
MKKSLLQFIDNRIIITTEQYDDLARTEKNRVVNIVHVKRMQESVVRHGILRNVIVVFNKHLNKYIIVDGQHLSVALQNLNMDIPCCLVKCETEEQMTQLMIDLNNTSKSWKLEDYINGWAASGNEHYKYLKTAIVMNDVQQSVIIQAYTQKKRLTATKMVKDGRFSIVDKAKGDQMIDNISNLLTILPSTRQMSEALVQIMLDTPDFDVKRMLQKSKKAVKTIAFVHNKEKQLRNQLLEIYNG